MGLFLEREKARLEEARANLKLAEAANDTKNIKLLQEEIARREANVLAHGGQI
jgi:hypothetical protein